MSKKDRKKKKQAVAIVIREAKQISLEELRQAITERLEKNFMKGRNGAWTL